MHIKRIILLYLFVFIIVTGTFPTVSFSYSPPIESITQYIIDISQDIHSLLQETEESLVYNSRGELRLRLLLSPW
ncbi:hypothetical protein KKC91_11985, partial [bacterium]|nr:hypothetical protein [bacterium]MBU1852682.1 hypothetical protein [Candidatus Omnitrophota bacterium]